MYLKPSEIYFSQDSIRNTWHDKSIHHGVNIGDTLDDICEGRCPIESIPPISVKCVNDRWTSADNRRLWVFRQLERLGMCKTILVRITNKIGRHKLTSKTDGKSVKVRRSIGGTWYSGTANNLQPSPPSDEYHFNRKPASVCSAESDKSRTNSMASSQSIDTYKPTSNVTCRDVFQREVEPRSSSATSDKTRNNEYESDETSIRSNRNRDASFETSNSRSHKCLPDPSENNNDNTRGIPKHDVTKSKHSSSVQPGSSYTSKQKSVQSDTYVLENKPDQRLWGHTDDTQEMKMSASNYMTTNTESTSAMRPTACKRESCISRTPDGMIPKSSQVNKPPSSRPIITEPRAWIYSVRTTDSDHKALAIDPEKRLPAEKATKTRSMPSPDVSTHESTVSTAAHRSHHSKQSKMRLGYRESKYESSRGVPGRSLKVKEPPISATRRIAWGRESCTSRTPDGIIPTSSPVSKPPSRRAIITEPRAWIYSVRTTDSDHKALAIDPEKRLPAEKATKTRSMPSPDVSTSESTVSTAAHRSHHSKQSKMRSGYRESKYESSRGVPGRSLKVKESPISVMPRAAWEPESGTSRKSDRIIPASSPGDKRSSRRTIVYEPHSETKAPESTKVASQSKGKGFVESDQSRKIRGTQAHLNEQTENYSFKDSALDSVTTNLSRKDPLKDKQFQPMTSYSFSKPDSKQAAPTTTPLAPKHSQPISNPNKIKPVPAERHVKYALLLDIKSYIEQLKSTLMRPTKDTSEHTSARRYAKCTTFLLNLESEIKPLKSALILPTTDTSTDTPASRRTKYTFVLNLESDIKVLKSTLMLMTKATLKQTSD